MRAEIQRLCGCGGILQGFLECSGALLELLGLFLGKFHLRDGFRSLRGEAVADLAKKEGGEQGEYDDDDDAGNDTDDAADETGVALPRHFARHESNGFSHD